MSALRAAGGRRVLVIAGGVLAVIAAVVIVVVVASGSGDAGGQSDTAVQLVPPGAQLYMHANVDQSSSQWRTGERLTTRLPSLRRLVEQQLARLGTGASPAELQTRIRPWLGDQAALALLPGRRRATSLILLSVRDRKGAETFLGSIGRTPRTARFRGAEIRTYGRVSAAFTGRPPYLAIGSIRNVQASIATGAGDSLGNDSTFRTAAGRVDTRHTLAYAYAPGEGARRLLAAQRGRLARVLGSFITPGLAAAIVTASPEPRGLRLNYADVLEPGATPSAGQGEFAATIPDSIGRNTIAYVGAEGVVRTLRLVARVAGQGGTGLGPLLGPVVRSLGPRGERELLAALAPLDDKEVGLVAEPPESSPAVTLIVSNVSQQEGGDLVAALQPLVSRLIDNPPVAGQVPTIEADQVQGADALTLLLTPSLSLTYASLGGRLYISNGGGAAIERLLAPTGSLTQNPAFAPGMRDLLDQASSVVFVDLARLPAVVSQAKSLPGPELSALGADLKRIGTVSAVTQSQPTSQTAEIFVGVP